MSAEPATARLARLLTMVPWLLNRQGVDIDEAAATFGVSRRQIEKDLELLFLCGTPGHMPDDLIEAEWEGGQVFVGNADTISRPLRLSIDEALALIVGLRAIGTVPGLEERDAIDRALAKLESAAGEAAVAGAHVAVSLDGPRPQVLVAARRALAERRLLRLRYLVAARDETTERDVSPMRLFTVDGHWYLEGWCHRAGAVRLFRLDRIVDITVLDADGTPPEHARSRDIARGVYSPAPEAPLVRLRLQPGASWVADYYPVEEVEHHEDGSLTVALRSADTAWVCRLLWRLGGQATVLSPPDLATRVVDGASLALARYTVP